MNIKNKSRVENFLLKIVLKLKNEGIGHEKVLPRRLYRKQWILFNDRKYPT